MQGSLHCDVKMQYDIVSLMICVSLMIIIINRVDKKEYLGTFLNWRVFKECGSNFEFNYDKQGKNNGVKVRGAKNLHMSYCHRSRWKFDLHLYLNPWVKFIIQNSYLQLCMQTKCSSFPSFEHFVFIPWILRTSKCGSRLIIK